MNTSWLTPSLALLFVGPIAAAQSAVLRTTAEVFLTPVQQVAFGQACGLDFRVTDEASLSHHPVRLSVSGAFPSWPIVYLFGGRRANSPIQGSPCRLFVEPIAGVALTARAAGAAVLPFDLPGPLQSAPFVLQSVAYDASLQARASAGVELQFVD